MSKKINILHAIAIFFTVILIGSAIGCGKVEEEPKYITVHQLDSLLNARDIDTVGLEPQALRVVPGRDWDVDSRDSINTYSFNVLSQTGTRETVIPGDTLLAWFRDSIQGAPQTLEYDTKQLTIDNGNTVVITGFADSTITTDSISAHLTRLSASDVLITKNTDSVGVHRIEISSLNNFRQYAALDSSEVYLNEYPLNSLITLKNSGARYLVSASPVSGYTTDSIGVIPTGSNYAILQPEQGFHDVRNFGATANDLTDDTRAFRKSVKFASITGADVKSQGTYIVDSFNLLSGVTLDNTGGVIQQVSDSVSNYPMIQATGVVHIRGGDIIGNKTFFTDNNVSANRLLKYLVNIDGATKATIENVRFEKSTATALRAINSYDFTVSNCTFEDIGYDATTVINAIYMGGYHLERAKILGCYFHHIGWDYDIAGISDADAIQILGANGDTYKEIRYIEISNNHFQGVDNRCIKMQDGFQVHISNNVADSANMFFSAAMADTVSDVTLVGNDIYNVTESFSAGAGNVELAIDFNILNNSMSNVYRALNASDSSFYVNLQYKGNIVRNSVYTVRAKGRDMYIEDNYFESDGTQTYPFALAAFTATSKDQTAGNYILRGNTFKTESSLSNVLNFGGSVKCHVVDNVFYYPTSSSAGFFNASTTSNDTSVVRGNYSNNISLTSYIGSAASDFIPMEPSVIINDILYVGTTSATSGYSINAATGLHVSGSNGSNLGNRVLNTSSGGYSYTRSSNNNNHSAQIVSFGSSNSQATNGAGNQGITASNDLLFIAGTTGSDNKFRFRANGWSGADQLLVNEADIEVKVPMSLVSLTTTERDALTATNGMIIYNETTTQLEAYENGSWVDL